MTVSSTENRESYTGNGTTTAFSFPYLFLDEADLVVLLEGATQTLNTDYTVSGVGNASGGTVTFGTAPDSGDEVVIYRDPQLLQPLDLVDNDRLPAEPTERSFDRLTLITQRNRDLLLRSARLSDALVGDVDPTLPTPEAGEVLAWNPDADGLRNVNLAELDEVVALGWDEDEVPQAGELRERGFPQQVDSVSTLRTTSFPASLQRIYLSGATGVGTANGGSFYADRSDSSTADDGDTVIVDSDGVRWKRADRNIETDTDLERQVNSISDLRSSSFVASLQRIWLRGYYSDSPGVGGGELFRSSGSDNGGTRFEAGDGSVWERAQQFVFTASQWGARTDTDSVDAINSGIANGRFAFDGLYPASDTIRIKTDSFVIGGGWGTGVQCSHSGNGLMVEDDSGYLLADRSSAVRDFFVSNFVVDGNGNADIGLYLVGFQNSKFDHIKAFNCTGHGWKVEGTSGWVGSGVYYSTWVGCYARENGGRGFWFERNGRAVNANTFIGGDAAYNGREGMYLETLFGGRFECTVEQNNQNTDGTEGDYEGYIDGCDSVSVCALFMENTTSTGMRRGIAFEGTQNCALEEGSHSGVLENLSGSTNISAYFIGTNTGTVDRRSSRRQTVTTGSGGAANVNFGIRCTQEPGVLFHAVMNQGRPVRIDSFNTDSDGFYTSCTIQLLNYDGTDRATATDIVADSLLSG